MIVSTKASGFHLSLYNPLSVRVKELAFSQKFYQTRGKEIKTQTLNWRFSALNCPPISIEFMQQVLVRIMTALHDDKH